MDAELSPTPEVLARIADIENKPMDSREIKKSRKDYFRSVEKELQHGGGLGVPEFYDENENYFQGNEPTDFWARLLAGIPSLQIPTDKADIQAQYAVEAFREKAKGTVIFDEKSEQFRYYSAGKWHDLDRRRMGIYLRDFAIELGCGRYAMGSYKGIEGLLKQAEYELITCFEPKRGLLNFPNGTMELATMKFRGHLKEDNLTWQLNYKYDQNAKCPNFEKFLGEVLDIESITLLQEICGYLFSDMKLEKVAFLVGGGKNGKSTFIDAVINAIGKENTSACSLAQISEPTGIYRADMENKILNSAADNGQKISDFATFKSYASGEMLWMKKLYQQPYKSNSYPKSIFAANSLPIVEDYSSGFYRRLLIVEWNYTVPEEKTNINLTKELESDAAGILNWMIFGAIRLRKQGKFSESKSAAECLASYRKESDPISQFVDERGYLKGNKHTIKLTEIYNLATAFLQNNGYSKMSSRTLATRLRQLGFKVEKGAGNNQYLHLGNDEESIIELRPDPFCS